MEEKPNMKNKSVHRIALCALIAAVYAALTMALSFMSYGGVQFRIAEALCVLPYFFPFTSWGLFVGCLIANLISPVGILDIVFGSLTTLAACWCTAWFGKKNRERWGRCIGGALMPVVWNAVVIGLLLAVTAVDPAENSAPRWVFFLTFAGEVGFGELVVMFVLGLPLMRWLPKSRWYGDLSAALDNGR